MQFIGRTQPRAHFELTRNWKIWLSWTKIKSVISKCLWGSLRKCGEVSMFMMPQLFIDLLCLNNSSYYLYLKDCWSLLHFSWAFISKLYSGFQRRLFWIGEKGNALENNTLVFLLNLYEALLPSFIVDSILFEA